MSLEQKREGQRFDREFPHANEPSLSGPGPFGFAYGCFAREKSHAAVQACQRPTDRHCGNLLPPLCGTDIVEHHMANMWATMDVWKFFRDVLIGGLYSVMAGAILFVPSCVVSGIIVWDEAQGEHIAGKLFWLYVIGGFVISFFVSLGRFFVLVADEQKQVEAQRERARQAEIAAAEAHKVAQESMGTELVKLSSDSLRWLESMPQHLLNAEQFLDQAEHDLQDGAFAPFWTSIERATTRLGTFDEMVLELSRFSRRYKALSATFEGTALPFPINVKSVSSMGVVQATADRLNAIVRKAQTNFQFAMIYEQRKTNQLLVAGFANLALALDGMGHRIASSIDGLREQISAMSSAIQESFSALGEQIQDSNQQIVESVDALHATTRQSTSEIQGIKERHDRALEMLDNIQKHRQPIGSL